MRTCLLLLVGGVPAIVGCAPAVVLEAPADWPKEYAHRRLFNTPNAFLYAGSEEAAGEADRLIIAVARDFEKLNGRKPKKGLVFVTDAKDDFLVPNLRELVAAAKAMKALQPDKTPAKDDPLAKWDETEKKMKTLGMEMDALLKALPIPLPKDGLLLMLNLPKNVTDGADWAMAMPTKAAVRDVVQKLIGAALKQQDTGPLAQAMAGLLMGMVNIERTVTDAFAVTRDLALYGMWVNAQADWSAEEKQKKIQAYAQRRQEETFGGLLAGSMKAAQKPPAVPQKPPEAGEKK